jgi:hypothetical protein
MLGPAACLGFVSRGPLVEVAIGASHALQHTEGCSIYDRLCAAFDESLLFSTLAKAVSSIAYE